MSDKTKNVPPPVPPNEPNREDEFDEDGHPLIEEDDQDVREAEE